MITMCLLNLKKSSNLESLFSLTAKLNTIAISKKDVPNASKQQSESDLSDEELRGMVASMQMQMTQVNMLTMQLTQQNAMLTQQLTELKTNKTNTEGTFK